ncbi:MAG TPA: FAD synthetase family protein [Chlamydiales bacterium]|nr:FAD synthetase family protein [Chlamydiales bacterium]
MKTALTIGFFDGVHLGHQALLRALRLHPHATIVTFSNHPQAVFKPPAPPLLTPLPEKIDLLKTYADEVIVLPFTLAFANTPFDEFLSQYDLSHLVLGAGSSFGKNREGTEANVRKYAASRGITVAYIPKVLLNGEPVSSTRIRQALASGDLTLAKQLTGRL